MVDLVTPLQLAINYYSKVLESVHPFKAVVVQEVGHRRFYLLARDVDHLALAHIKR